MKEIDKMNSEPRSPDIFHKKKIHVQDFKTRKERLKALTIPNTNKRRVIIPSNDRGLGFKSNWLTEEQLINLPRISIEKTITEANKIIDATWLRRRSEEGRNLNSKSYNILILSAILVVFGFILEILMISTNKHPSSEWLLLISVLVIGVAAALSTIIVIRGLVIKPKFINFEKEAMKNLLQFIHRENNELYLSLGYRWEIEKHFFWLEIHILDD
jgi:hypothetical protein